MGGELLAVVGGDGIDRLFYRIEQLDGGVLYLLRRLSRHLLQEGEPRLALGEGYKGLAAASAGNGVGFPIADTDAEFVMLRSYQRAAPEASQGLSLSEPRFMGLKDFPD